MTSDAVIEYLRAIKARAVVASPPQLSSLRILPPPNSAPLLGLRSGHISSADKNLVAFYAGGYRPGADTIAEMGAYLIYDARDGSLSVIPPIPSDDEYMATGHQSAVVMCDATGTGGGYLLAELVWVMPGFSRAAVWLWVRVDTVRAGPVPVRAIVWTGRRRSGPDRTEQASGPLFRDRTGEAKARAGPADRPTTHRRREGDHGVGE